MSADKATSEKSVSADDAAFEFRLLGPFTLIHCVSGTSAPVTAAKMRALLALLCASPGFTEKRRRIAGLLWASREDNQARHNLRQLLSQFKRAEGERATILLTYDDESISLNANYLVVDSIVLANARKSTDIATLSKAADAYRGEFGSGLEIGESEFDEWLGDQRIRCGETAISILDRLVRLLAETGQHREALERANRLLEIEPFREETHRLVITQEDIVSGRASALARFQSFKTRLQDDVGVAPEQATLDLVESLRTRAETRASSQELVKKEETGSPEADILPSMAAPRKNRHRPAFVAASITALFLVVAGLVGGASAIRWLTLPMTFVGEDIGRVSVALLPFEFETTSEDMHARVRTYETEAKLAFARDNRFAIVEASETAPRDPIGAGRLLRTRYVMRTRLTETAGNISADVHLFDTASGISLSAASVPLDGGQIKFARELYRTVYPEIILHRAKTLAATQPDSILALLWSAEAARIKTRVGSATSNEFVLFEAVLKREPNQLHALLGLSNSLILRVAREQSPNRAQDI